MMVNGMLAGLVAITAPSGYVGPIAGSIIGAHCRRPRLPRGGLHRAGLKRRRPGRGDRGPRGQRPVGGLAAGLFADGTSNYGGLSVTGLFYGNVGPVRSPAHRRRRLLCLGIRCVVRLLQGAEPVPQDAGVPGDRAAGPRHSGDGHASATSPRTCRPGRDLPQGPAGDPGHAARPPDPEPPPAPGPRSQIPGCQALDVPAHQLSGPSSERNGGEAGLDRAGDQGQALVERQEGALHRVQGQPLDFVQAEIEGRIQGGQLARQGDVAHQPVVGVRR